MNYEISARGYIAVIIGIVVTIIGIKELYSLLLRQKESTIEGLEKNKVTVFWVGLHAILCMMVGPIFASFYFIKYSNIESSNMSLLNDILMILIALFGVVNLYRLNYLPKKYGVQRQNDNS